MDFVLGVNNTINDIENENDDNDTGYYVGIGVIFAVSWLYSAVNVLSRKLKNMHFSMVLFYHACFGLAIMIVWILVEKFIFGNPFRYYTGR